jgi:haloalkane dehalogenase
MISTKPHPQKTIDVLGKKMAYVELGDSKAAPVVFLHGNPTSSYLWRNIMPHLSSTHRCLAPDLIGMGNSEKLDDGDYRFVAHRKYLDGWFQALGLTENITLVIHDWGSALGFDFANRNRGAVKAIAYMEGIVCPIESWDKWPEAARKIFQGFRSAAGEEMILEKNIFIENVLPGSIVRDLSSEEMEIYRKPFARAGGDRRPTLTWPREIPIAGEPADVVKIVGDYAQYMSENDMPKLFINAKPGAILTGEVREFCRQWKNQTEVEVKGAHFIQEDSPDEIGEAIKQWLL